jgi:hypothetical protein
MHRGHRIGAAAGVVEHRRAELGRVLTGAGADEPDPVRLTQAFDRVVRDRHVEHPLELVGFGADRAFERSGGRCCVGHVPSRS